MLENVKEKCSNAVDKIDDFGTEHPTAYSVILTAVCGAVLLPICFWAYKWQGEVQGRALAKELVKAGVKVRYTYDN